MTLAWLRGLLTRRPLRVWGAATGVALTVAFLACLGAFITRSIATMTQRAVEGVAVDWQVLLAPNADPGTVRGALQAVGVKALELVGYADGASPTGPAGQRAPAARSAVARSVRPTAHRPAR